MNGEEQSLNQKERQTGPLTVFLSDYIIPSFTDYIDFYRYRHLDRIHIKSGGFALSLTTKLGLSASPGFPY